MLDLSPGGRPLADLLITGARIIDGSGKPSFYGSLAVDGDRVQCILRPDEREPAAQRRIEGAGLVLCPGFIDVHDHSDLAPFVEPGMGSKLRQGITTVVSGNCGSSAGTPTGALDMAGWFESMGVKLETGWQSHAEYLDRLEACRPAVNMAVLVGHGALRLQVMGNATRAPTTPEMAAMQELLAEAMEAGGGSRVGRGRRQGRPRRSLH